MAKLEWDLFLERKFDYGVYECALYLDDDLCVPWNGIVSIEESLGEAQGESVFFEGSRFIAYTGQEDFSLSVTSFTYPEEFLPYFGVKQLTSGVYTDSQIKKPFNLVYKSSVGNGIDGLSGGYKINILYDLVAIENPSPRSTSSQSLDPTTFSWEFKTKPSLVGGGRPTSRVIIDSTLIDQQTILEIEKIIYGSETTNPSLPPLAEFVKYANEFGLIVVVLNSDGTWTATGPDEYFTMLDSTTFMITNMNGFFIDSDTYQISSSEP